VSKPSREERAAFEKLDALYAQLPPLACKGLCAISCQGGIVLTDLEARRLQLTTHTKPRTTDARGRCVYLTPDDRCAAHAIRPLICRAWGVVKMMSCIHGCAPARWCSDRAFLDLAVAIERLGGGRVLRTVPEGLAHVPGESFSGVAARVAIGPQADEARLARDADRTLGLRALHGGRIMLARAEDR
jgi:Fe-S-cluster containining protein